MKAFEAIRRGASLRDRIKALSTPEPNTGCWLWLAQISRNGYPKIKLHGAAALAHRVSYKAFVGPIPEGLTLDHLCRTPSCVNPEHLEPVTNLENHRRGFYATQSHCVHGHPFNEENTYIRPGSSGRQRQCKTCNRFRTARYRRQLVALSL